ncbi:MAG: AMP-binding protein [Candidatus Omnitrophica bacterium]|nr:AMP-binding protein [Candidatus Omnitrophota bacterium]
MNQTIYQAFEAIAQQCSRKTAVLEKVDQKWLSITFGRLYSKTKAISCFLTKHNINKEDKVAIILDNCWQWIAIFFAVLSRGAIVVPVNPESSELEINNILLDAQAKMAFLSKKSEDRKIQIQNIIYLDSNVFRQILGRETEQTQVCSITEDDIACILYTSGTTSEPKGVMLSHKNFLANCKAISKIKITNKNDKILAILPLHHAFALTVTMLLPMLSGFTIIYPQTFRGEGLLSAMQEQNPSIFVAVPQIFYAFHQRIAENFQKIPLGSRIILTCLKEILYFIRRITGINISKFLFLQVHRRFGRTMRLFVSGGAKLDVMIALDLFKHGFTILEGYGLTETAPVLTFNPYKKPKIGSVGIPLPGIDLKLENKNQQGVGEVVVRGPNIMQGYYKKPDDTAKVIRQQWFYTGDLGWIDGSGYLFLTGRAKEIIVLSSGLNVFPEEIEQIYTKQSPVKEMCVYEAFSRAKLKKTSVLWATVVPDLEYFKNLGEVSLKTVLKNKFDSIARLLPDYKRIRGFSITMEPLPRTLLGKIKRFAVHENYLSKIEKNKPDFEEKEISPEHKVLMQSKTGEKIIKHLKQYTQTAADITPGDLLEIDLGLDSLGRVELASELEKVFNINIKDEVIGHAFTVEDLIIGMELLLKQGAEVLPQTDARKPGEKLNWKKLLEVLPNQQNLSKIDLCPGLVSRLTGTIFIEIVRLILFLCFRMRVTGQNNIPKQGQYILFSNHTSYLDGFIIGAGLPNYTRMDLFFLGLRPYFNVPVIRAFLKTGRIIPLDFVTHLMEALRSCYYVLNNNKNLCLFPEGMRSLDGSVQPFKRGFGILAKETKARLVPVLIEGAFKAWPRTARFPRFYPIKVSYGVPLDIKDLEAIGFGLGARDAYEAICLAARKQLQTGKEKTVLFK